MRFKWKIENKSTIINQNSKEIEVWRCGLKGKLWKKKDLRKYKCVSKDLCLVILFKNEKAKDLWVQCFLKK